MRDNIIAKQAKVSETDKPSDWSDEAVDFVNKLLMRKREARLGNDAPGTARLHPWFDKFDWKSLQNMTMTSPFSGIVSIDILTKKLSDMDGGHLNKNTTEDEKGGDKAAFLKDNSNHKIFADYYLDRMKEPPKESQMKKIDPAKFDNTQAGFEKTTKVSTMNTLHPFS